MHIVKWKPSLNIFWLGCFKLYTRMWMAHKAIVSGYWQVMCSKFNKCFYLHSISHLRGKKTSTNGWNIKWTKTHTKKGTFGRNSEFNIQKLKEMSMSDHCGISLATNWFTFKGFDFVVAINTNANTVGNAMFLCIVVFFFLLRHLLSI